MGLLSVLLPNFTADVVGVFDDNFNQVFPQARPVKAVIKERSKVMEHPVETGVTITDHRIIEPIEIELSLFMSADDYRSTYAQIKALYNAASLLTVQTRTSTYSSMIIMDMPHDETSEVYDSITMALRLKEVLFVQASFGTLPPSKVANKSNASTDQRGEQQPQSTTVAKGLENDISAWWKKP